MTAEDLIQELQRFPSYATVVVVVPVGTMDCGDEEICGVERVDRANYGKTVVQLHIDSKSL